MKIFTKLVKSRPQNPIVFFTLSPAGSRDAVHGPYNRYDDRLSMPREEGNGIVGKARYGLRE